MNWMRRNVPPSTWASVLTVSVLARPGTPSSSTWPPARSADEQALEHRVLADDDALDLVQRGLERVARLVEARLLLGPRASPGRRRTDSSCSLVVLEVSHQPPEPRAATSRRRPAGARARRRRSSRSAGACACSVPSCEPRRW